MPRTTFCDAPAAAASTSRGPFAATRPFTRGSARKEAWFLVSTFAVMAAFATVAVLPLAWPLRLLGSLGTGLTMVRAFILFHDRHHGAAFTESRIAKLVLDAYGLLLLTPPRLWRYTHNYHHAHTARTDGDQRGTYTLFTTEQWRNASKRERFAYRAEHYPLTLLFGYVFVLLGFVTMLLFWREGAAYWSVGLGYAFVGAGVGLAGTPASHSLTGAVPVRRAGMASGTADLQRDLGGAIMQSILGALLTAGYAASVNKLIEQSPNSDQVTSAVQSELAKSFSSAENTAEQYPQYADAIIQGAKDSFVAGQDWAYVAGIVAVLLGAVIVAWKFPKADREKELLAQYQAEDEAAPA